FYAKELATPNGAVETVSGTVPGNTQIGTLDVVLRGARGHMCLMMLHADQRKSGFFRPMRRSIIRVQVTGDNFRLETIETAKVVNRLFERSSGFDRLKFSDILVE